MFSIAKLLLAVVGAIAQYLATKKAIDAGEAKAVLEAVREADRAISRAVAARNRVPAEPDEHDPYRRD